MVRKSRNNSSGGGTAAGRPKQNTKAGSKSRDNGSNSRGFAPNSVGTTTTKRSPRLTAAGGVRVTNTEFVADLTVGTQLAFDVNPLASSTFTWLGRIASAYEIFRIHRLVFKYTPICSSTTTGVVVMAYDYDASDAPPTTKQAISAYDGSQRTNVWNSLSCPFRAPDSWYFVGQQGLTINPASTDIKMYDPAKFYANVFNAAAGTVGEISVEYDVEFAKPAFDAPPAGYETIQFTGANTSNMIGTPSYNGTLTNTVSSPGPGILTINFTLPGPYLIEVVASVTAASAVQPVLQSATQTDPGASSSFSVPSLDSLATGWINSSTYYSTITLYNVVVLAGSTLTIPVAAAITAAYMNRLRITPSVKTLT